MVSLLEHAMRLYVVLILRLAKANHHAYGVDHSSRKRARTAVGFLNFVCFHVTVADFAERLAAPDPDQLGFAGSVDENHYRLAQGGFGTTFSSLK
jgi:hypothetical protein